MSIASWRNRKELLWSGYYPGRNDAALAIKSQLETQKQDELAEEFILFYAFFLVLKKTEATYAEHHT